MGKSLRRGFVGIAATVLCGGAAAESQVSCDLTLAPLPQNVQLLNNAKKLLSIENQRVTPLWAQEAIGSPEAMEFLNWFDRENPTRKVVWVPVGINDGGIFLNYLAPEKLNEELRRRLAAGIDVAPVNPTPESQESRKHAYSVSTLIADPNGTGVGHRAYYSWFSNALVQRDVAASFSSAQVKPKFVNRSVGVRMPGGTDDSADIHTISSQTVIVAASGNTFPWPTDKGTYRSIIVGAIEPSGLMAEFSQSGSGLTVSAPGHFVLAMVSPGQMDAISGTSFAAPLVTGVLSTVESILPGITFDELKEMLRRTAIPTVAFSHPATWDGWGVVNQSKLMRAAHRLVSGWPGNRSHISADWVYDFKPEVAFRKAQVQALRGAETCEATLDRLKLLRQNFFLEPTDSETRLELADLYRSQRYLIQALYFDDPNVSLTKKTVRAHLDGRKFQLDAVKGDVASMRSLQNSISLKEVPSINLILFAAQKGTLEVFRFLTEEWQPALMTPDLASKTLSIARAARNEAVAQHIRSRY